MFSPTPQASLTEPTQTCDTPSFPHRVIVTPLYTVLANPHRPTRLNRACPLTSSYARRFYNESMCNVVRCTIRGSSLVIHCVYDQHTAIWFARETCIFCKRWRHILGGWFSNMSIHQFSVANEKLSICKQTETGQRPSHDVYTYLNEYPANVAQCPSWLDDTVEIIHPDFGMKKTINRFKMITSSVAEVTSLSLESARLYCPLSRLLVCVCREMLFGIAAPWCV